MNKNKILAAVALAAVILNTGCTPKLGGSDYATAGVGEISETFEGIIVGKRVVQLHDGDPTKAGDGASAGGLAGGLLGSTMGNGNGQLGMMAVGAIGGAVAGHLAEQSIRSQQGFEYQVKLLKTKEVVSIAQGAEPNLSVGQPVYMIRSNRANSRIVPR